MGTDLEHGFSSPGLHVPTWWRLFTFHRRHGHSLRKPLPFAFPTAHSCKCPSKEYDPDQDPYFDRFGGRMAFAAFIAINPIVERSLDVRSLLPEGKWFEAANRLAAASQIKCQREALLDWQNDYQKWYFTWRSNRTKEETKLKARFQANRGVGQLEDPEGLRMRRGCCC